MDHAPSFQVSVGARKIWMNSRFSASAAPENPWFP
jgi:hypothetical protein